MSNALPRPGDRVTVRWGVTRVPAEVLYVDPEIGRGGTVTVEVPVDAPEDERGTYSFPLRIIEAPPAA